MHITRKYYYYYSFRLFL